MYGTGAKREMKRKPRRGNNRGVWKVKPFRRACRRPFSLAGLHDIGGVDDMGWVYVVSRSM